MRMTLILGIILLTSCGRQNDRSCRNREHMRIQCQAETMPSYGRPYAQDYCNRTYEADRCY